MKATPSNALGLLSLGSLTLVATGCQPPKPWSGLTPEKFARVNEHRIRGVALLENDKADLAAAEFEAIQKQEPNLAFGYINEAASFALKPDRSQAVLPEIRKGIELLPRSGWPHLVEAALLRNTGQNEEATKALEKALQKEPQNPRVIGAMVRQLRDLPGDHSARLYDLRKQLVTLAPDNAAAQLEWLQSQMDGQEAAGVLQTLQKIEELVPRMGPDVRDYFERARKALAGGAMAEDRDLRALVNLLRGEPVFKTGQNEIFGAPADPAVLLMREWDTPPPPIPAPALKPVAVTWKDVTASAGLGSVTAPGLAPVAIADLDLWPEAGKKAGEVTQRFQDRPNLVLGAAPQAALSSTGTGFQVATPPAGEGSPLAADFNNDFVPEVYVAAPGGDFLWRSGLQGNTRSEQFTVTRGAPVKIPVAAKGPGMATAVDLDQDGDLDVVRASGDPSQPAVRYLRNNGDWAFSDLTASSGLNLPSEGTRQVVYADFDNDVDLDLFVVRENGDCRLFLNQRQDVFGDGTESWAVKKGAGALSAVVADPDRDDDWDLLVLGAGEHGTVFYRNNAGKGFEADAAAVPLPDSFQPRWAEWLDYDNDSWLDLVVAGEGGLLLFHNSQGKLEPAETPLQDPARWVSSLDYDRDGDLDLLAVTPANKLKLLSNEGGNARPWIRVELQGYLVDPKNLGPGEATQGNNSYGIGTKAEVRTVWGDQPLLMDRPVKHLGLAPAEQAVAVRVTWTHGVPQDAIAPQANAPLHFTQIPTGSCPYLYAWDGNEWRFVKDFNWRSPLGMLAARGKPVPHDLTLDWDKIPGGWLQPVGGYYRLSATEELREISYFDWMQLLAVDHPEGTEVYVDERFPFGPADPFRIYTTRQERRPASARNETGQDLLPALEKVDNVYTPVPPATHLRGVSPPHDLILDLGQVPDPANVKLFLHGWIYPQPNSTNINTSQGKSVVMIPPTLYVGDGKGGWTGEDRSIGLPCGKRKTIVLDLGGRFQAGDYRVKLTTTSEIRWDAAFFTSGEAPVQVVRREIPLLGADLRERGVGQVYREVPDGPDLRRYDNAAMPDWPNIPGAYTRLGECSPLLRKVDDQYAIIAPGDEIRMVFDGRSVPPPPAGWKRDYIFLSDGWTKDTDSNTVSGETVEPLPFHGMKRYPYGPEERFPDTPAHRQWKREWNTRVKER